MASSSVRWRMVMTPARVARNAVTALIDARASVICNSSDRAVVPQRSNLAVAVAQSFENLFGMRAEQRRRCVRMRRRGRQLVRSQRHRNLGVEARHGVEGQDFGAADFVQ